MRTKTALILVLAFSLLVAFSASPVFGQGRGTGGQAVSALGVAQVGGQTVFVHIWAVVPPGADANEVAAQALREQGARPFDSQEFSTTGLVWDQFSDDSTTNDSVTQYYNPGSDNTSPQPTGVDGATALTRTYATWTNVSTSTFAFSSGGITDRCPSLVRECDGAQVFDSKNDVAWLELKGCCTLGVTWYGTSTDEADMALNTKFSWATDGANNYDVETVYLHENGHVAGLGHSAVTAAVMYKSYQGVRRVLHQDDINGISSLYPVPVTTTTGSIDGTVKDASTSPISGATVSTDTGQSTTTATDGSYTLIDVPTGTRTVTASATGYTSASQDVVVTEGGTAPANFSLTPAVTATSVSVSAVNYGTTGGRGGTLHLLITVVLVDNLGNPVAGAGVSIDVFRNGSFYGSGSGTTGTSGTVTFQASTAPSGTYTTTVTNVTASGLTWDGVTPSNSFTKS